VIADSITASQDLAVCNQGVVSSVALILHKEREAEWNWNRQ
jgi:hypothetical protein